MADPTGAQPTVKKPTYADTAVFYLPVTIAEDAPLGEQTITVALAYQACDDTSCLAPEFPEFDVTSPFWRLGPPRFLLLKSTKSSTGWPNSRPCPRRRLAMNRAILCQPPAMSPVAPSRSLFGFDIGATCSRSSSPVSSAGRAEPDALRAAGHPHQDHDPVAARPVRSQADAAARLWMAAGVAAFWIGVGIPVAATANSIDPSTVFSLWPVTLGMGLIIVLMGLGIMGLFTISLPKSTYMFNPKADSPSGSFLFGVMTAVLGLPCFGPIVGGLLAGGTALPASTVMIVFVGLGVGVAAPYLVLSANPAAREEGAPDRSGRRNG